MTKKTLEAHEFALQDVFCDKYEFEIPGYQRPYSWGEEESETLVEDLLDFLSEQKTDLRDCDPYFLGSLVLIKPGGAKAQVVDGQQRLTTLTILMSVLRDISSSKISDSLDKRIFQKGDEILMTDDKPRLKTRPKDQMFFHKYIQEPKQLNDLFLLKDKLNDSQSNIKKNAKIIYDRLVKCDPEMLIRLSQFLMIGCFVVVVTTPDVDSAYRIFSIMNDRGLDLSSTDILKSLVTGAISEINEKQKVYTDKWEDLEESVGRDNFNSLFSHIRMLEMRTKSRSNVVSDFKKIIRPEAAPELFIDEKLAPYARAYSELLDENFIGSEYQKEINRSLSCLNRIDNSDWVPSAIYYLTKYRQEPAKISKFMKSLERLASVLMVNRISINNRITRYSKVLATIDDAAEFSAESPLNLVEDEKRLAILQLSGPIYQISQIRVMVLLRLDSELSDGMATYNHPRITIEHVMPQTPKEGSQWKTWCPSEEEHQELIHCLGNLALLSRTKNSAANNYDFEKKKTAYFNRRDGHTAFVLTNDIIKESEWTPELIRRRQNYLVNKLVEAWDLV
jgi:hypothetical protein